MLVYHLCLNTGYVNIYVHVLLHHLCQHLCQNPFEVELRSKLICAVINGHQHDCTLDVSVDVDHGSVMQT